MQVQWSDWFLEAVIDPFLELAETSEGDVLLIVAHYVTGDDFESFRFEDAVDGLLYFNGGVRCGKERVDPGGILVDFAVNNGQLAASCLRSFRDGLPLSQCGSIRVVISRLKIPDRLVHQGLCRIAVG